MCNFVKSIFILLFCFSFAVYACEIDATFSQQESFCQAQNWDVDVEVWCQHKNPGGLVILQETHSDWCSNNFPGSPYFTCTVDPQCPAGYERNGIKCQNTKPCDGDSSSSASNGAASSAAANPCPSNQSKDANGTCTSCPAGKVQNIDNGACEDQTQCTYPQLYSWYDNACSQNSQNCAQGAHLDPLTGSCAATNSTTCPSGFTCADSQCLTCSPTANSNSSSGANTSSGQDSSSGNNNGGSNGSSGNQNSGQNSSVNHSQNSSNIPLDDPSGNGSGNPVSQTTCKSDGTGCHTITTTPVGSNFNCPNSYTDSNGQKYCVTTTTGTNGNGSSGNGTGSGTQSSTGQCDPTSPSYDECMGRNQVPSPEKTNQLITDLESKNSKSLSDYEKMRKDDIDQAKNGISFANAPNQLQQLVSSLVPPSGQCQPIKFKFPRFDVETSCEIFDYIKVGLAWFFSILVILDIFNLALKPVEK